MFEPIVIPESGLECDNPECDWKDATILMADFKSYIDTPCPKCGENVLTLEDYKTTVEFELQIDFTNNMLSLMSDEEREIFYNGLAEEITASGEEIPEYLSVKIHKGIHISFKNNSESQE